MCTTLAAHTLPQRRFPVPQGIAMRNALGRLGVSSVSPNNLHYSWDWGPLHLVQLNLYPGTIGDEVSPAAQKQPPGTFWCAPPP
jgi:hypothetical protein